MSLPTNECKTNQFCSNGQLFIQFSDAFQYNLTFISENIERWDNSVKHF